MKLWVELWVGAFSGFVSNLLKDMVGPWGLEPQTSTVSILLSMVTRMTRNE